jgi:hypothetical protein
MKLIPSPSFSPTRPCLGLGLVAVFQSSLACSYSSSIKLSGRLDKKASELLSEIELVLASEIPVAASSYKFATDYLAIDAPATEIAPFRSTSDSKNSSLVVSPKLIRFEGRRIVCVTSIRGVRDPSS